MRELVLFSQVLLLRIEFMECMSCVEVAGLNRFKNTINVMIGFALTKILKIELCLGQWFTLCIFASLSFFTPEQTSELKAMFQAIKFKSKQFAHDNAKKGKIDGLNFRRLKFYDMILSLLIVFIFGVVKINTAQAGNDPGIFQKRLLADTNIYPLTVEDLMQRMYEYQSYIVTDGNDPGDH